MTSRILALAFGALCISSACAPGASDVDRPAIRVGYSGEADFGDLPSFIAHERLRARGVALTVTHYSAPDLAIEAASRGSADIVHGTMIGAWSAVVRGARIRTVADHVANPYRLVATSASATCADLDGRRLALAGESAISTLLVRAYFAEACPGTRPVSMIVLESSGRAAALLSGYLDAAAMDLNTVLWLQARAPGRFHVVSDFSARWPGIKTTGVHVNIAFADAHPDLVRDYVHELEAANRDVLADRTLLTSAAEKHLGPSADWTAIADAYVESRVWPVMKGLARSDVAQTLSFFKAYSSLPAETSPDAVVRDGFFHHATDLAGE